MRNRDAAPVLMRSQIALPRTPASTDIMKPNTNFAIFNLHTLHALKRRKGPTTNRAFLPFEIPKPRRYGQSLMFILLRKKLKNVGLLPDANPFYGLLESLPLR